MNSCNKTQKQKTDDKRLLFSMPKLAPAFFGLVIPG